MAGGRGICRKVKISDGRYPEYIKERWKIADKKGRRSGYERQYHKKNREWRDSEI